MTPKTGKVFRTGRVSIVLVLLALLSACAQTQNNRAAGLNALAENSKIILMPLDIQLGLLNAGGITEPRADWTNAARGHLNSALVEMLDDADTDLIVGEGLDPYAGLDEVEVQLIKLHGALGRSILLHQYIPALKLPSRAEGFDWTLGPETKRLKEQYGADYALFVYIRDNYSSSGRAAVVAIGLLLGVGVQGGQQVGFASLVDLETGQIAWFNRLFSTSGDLRTADAARESATALMAGFPE